MCGVGGWDGGADKLFGTKDILTSDKTETKVCIRIQSIHIHSPDYCSDMNTRKKRKLGFHTGWVSKIGLFSVHLQDKAKRKSSKNA